MAHLGEIFALLAAASNGTIGVLTKVGLGTHIGYIDIAFFKCLGAYLTIGLMAVLHKNIRRDVARRRQDAPKIAVLSLFGVFILYYFETLAFSLAPIPLVAFLTYASGAFTVILGVTVLREPLTRAKILSLVLVFSGVYLMFDEVPFDSLSFQGGLVAVAGGLGYSIFMVLWRVFKIPGSFGTLWWFFGWGTLYLAVPFFFGGSGLPPLAALPSLLALILIPSIGGYYLTSKALTLAEASKVQILETSDPLFASLYGFLLFGEVLSFRGGVGALLIFLGIVLLVLPPRRTRVTMPPEA